MTLMATAFPELRSDVPLREQRRRHQVELGILAPDDVGDDEDGVEPAEAFAGQGAEASPAPRTCSECRLPLPEDWPARRVTCSASCSAVRAQRQKRHQSSNGHVATEIRHGVSHLGPIGLNSPQDLGNVPQPGEFSPGPSLLNALTTAATQLPTGWRAELEAAGVVLKWTPA